MNALCSAEREGVSVCTVNNSTPAAVVKVKCRLTRLCRLDIFNRINALIFAFDLLIVRFKVTRA